MKKLLFLLCLCVPLGLFIYGKVSPMVHEAREAAQITNAVRQIPLTLPTPPKLDDAFTQLRKPVLPSVPHVAPKVTHAKPKPRLPLPKAAPAPQPVAEEPLLILPEARELGESCHFGFLSIHCAFN